MLSKTNISLVFIRDSGEKPGYDAGSGKKYFWNTKTALIYLKTEL